MYCDFPAIILSEVWSHFTVGVHFSRVLKIRTPGDITALEKRITEVRLVWVENPRMYVAAAWAIQMAKSFAGPRPLLIGQFEPADGVEDPAATLVLRCNQDEKDRITTWLSWQETGESTQIDVQSQIVHFDSSVCWLESNYYNSVPIAAAQKYDSGYLFRPL